MVTLQQAGWSAENYQLIMQTAEDTFLAGARVRAVLRRGPAAVDRHNVSVPKVAAFTLTAPVATPPTRVGVNFTVPSDFIDDVEAVRVLVRKAAQTLAAAESRVLVKGDNPLGANIAPMPPPSQLIAAGPPTPIPVTKAAPLDGLATALGHLHVAGHFDDYALLGEPGFMVDIAGLVTGTDDKIALLFGGPYQRAVFYGVPAGGSSAGALVALSGVDLVEVEPLTLITLGVTNGGLDLRLQTRVVLRVLDATAIVPLEFGP